MRFQKKQIEKRHRICAIMRAAKERKRIERANGSWIDPEPQRVPEGKPLGVLTWHSQDGTVRRWVVTQGPRANNIGVIARVAGGDEISRVMGWDKFLAALRKRLAVPKRLLDTPAIM